MLYNSLTGSKVSLATFVDLLRLKLGLVDIRATRPVGIPKRASDVHD